MNAQEERPGRNDPDGPGEALVDEPTEHALDPEPDPNTEWEKKAGEETEEDDGGGE